MKKTIVNVIILSVLLVSCGKSSKAKVSNDWRVTSYEESFISIDEDGEKSTETLSITESTYNENVKDEQFGNFTYSATGTVQLYNYTINKNGTWSSESEVEYTNSQGTSTTKSIKSASGTWAFIGKTKGDDFKKNERILFNTLAESTELVKNNGQSPSSLQSKYLTGEKTRIYTVKESERKKLMIESSEKYVSTEGSTVSTKERLIKIVMKQA